MLLEAMLDPNPESQQEPRHVLNQQYQPLQQQQPSTSTADADDEDLPEPPLEPIGSGSVLFDRVHQMMEKFAATRIGQYVLEHGDRVLRTIEDTVKWSLPQDKAAVPLVRPLPWIPFLMLIIFLRQLRICLSLVALFIGNNPVTPYTIIYFIQTRRRKLRSIRINGMKAIQQEAADRKALKPEYDNKFLMNLCKIFTIARCRPRLGCQPAGIVFAADNPANRELLRAQPPLRHKFKREREDDDPIKEFITARLMSKFSSITSDDDSDYVPKADAVGAEDSNDESTLSPNNTTSDTQGEYSLDTTGENVDEQIIDECEETNEKKSLSKSERTEDKSTLNEQNKKATEVNKKSEAPEKKVSDEIKGKPKEEEKKIIPTIEISGSEEKNNLPKDPKDQKGKQEEIVSPSSDKTITASPKTPTSPVDNGKNKSGINDDVSEAEAISVESQSFKSLKEQFYNIVNGHQDEQKKATPGHESAADTKPHIPPALLSNTTTNVSRSGSGNVLINANANDADCFAKQTVELTNKSPTQPQPTSPPQQPKNPTQTQPQPKSPPRKPTTPPQPQPQQPAQSFSTSPSSPSRSSTTSSSSSSLASFTSSDECVAANADFSDAPTPTPSLNEASSTEDIYLSPIGSPTFTTFNKPTVSGQTDRGNDDDEQRAQHEPQRTGRYPNPNFRKHYQNRRNRQ